MNYKAFVSIIFLLLSFNAFAKESDKTIPFISYSYVAWPINKKTLKDISNLSPLEMKDQYTSAASVSVSSEVNQISTKNIANFLMDVKKAVCGNMNDADVRIWISFDTKAKMLAVSASAQTGMEVLFHCNPKT